MIFYIVIELYLATIKTVCRTFQIALLKRWILWICTRLFRLFIIILPQRKNLKYVCPSSSSSHHYHQQMKEGRSTVGLFNIGLCREGLAYNILPSGANRRNKYLPTLRLHPRGIDGIIYLFVEIGGGGGLRIPRIIPIIKSIL